MLRFQSSISFPLPRNNPRGQKSVHTIGWVGEGAQEGRQWCWLLLRERRGPTVTVGNGQVLDGRFQTAVLKLV